MHNRTSSYIIMRHHTASYSIIHHTYIIHTSYIHHHTSVLSQCTSKCLKAVARLRSIISCTIDLCLTRVGCLSLKRVSIKHLHRHPRQHRHQNKDHLRSPVREGRLSALHSCARGFVDFEPKMSAAAWTWIAILIATCLQCAWLHVADRRDWIEPRRNMEAYFTPPHPARRRRGVLAAVKGFCVSSLPDSGEHARVSPHERGDACTEACASNLDF